MHEYESAFPISEGDHELITPLMVLQREIGMTNYTFCFSNERKHTKPSTN